MNDRSLTDCLLSPDSTAFQLLQGAATRARIAVFCGIPGTGKSLFVREQVKLALAAKRRVTLMQWDVARQAFELPEILQRYPEVEGATHAMIRRAAGIWSRQAIAQWNQRSAAPAEMLIVEAPLVGGRWAELARPTDDTTEPLLRSNDSRYFVPTPSVAVRKAIEAARHDETAAHKHARDAANAIPQLMDELWRQVAATAASLHLIDSARSAEYHPGHYYAVYKTVLKHRQVAQIPVDEIVKIADSPHALGTTVPELSPAPEQVPALLAAAESEGENHVRRQTELWYQT